ncbi:hypothetical protein C8Q74DRAFT_302184 [Fomes fomentarius]|nr:hypothetical protein C8Q74DRAFT_302184 [Fomes fomentarius]
MIITWRATYRTSREAAEVLHQKSTLSKVLLRDGAMYFIVLSIMNTLHLSLTLNAIFAVNNLGSNGSFIELLIEPLSTIIISRFLIDLQAANNEMMHQHSQVSSIGSLHFMGSLASSLPAPGERSPVCSIQDNDENARDVGYDMAGTGIIMDGSTPLAHSSVEEGTSREFGTMGVSS